MKMSNFALAFQHCKNALFHEWAKNHIPVHFTGGDVGIKQLCIIFSLGKISSVQYVSSILLCDGRITQRLVGQCGY